MKYYLLLIGLVFTCLASVNAQVRPAGRTSGKTADAELDSLRKLEEEKQDTVIFTAKYIRYTTVGLLKDSTRTVFLDTALTHFHNYNPLIQPERPTVNLGNIGQPARELLFNPRKTIGFDPGFHSLDFYRLSQDSIRYYRARTPYTSLYYVNGTLKEQTFRITHSQNIKPNWNFGANYFRINNQGFYTNQNTSDLNATVFTWYEGPKKRYNLLVNGLFNTLKNAENGSVEQEDIFNQKRESNISPTVKLRGTPVRNVWKQKEYFIKQFYYIGRLDTVKNADSVIASVRPTQRFSHQFTYANDTYLFDKPNTGTLKAFPQIEPDSVSFPFKDSTTVKRISNEFRYSFYLRGRSLSFVKNELKLDVGLQHDFYKYQQLGPEDKFQNITLKGDLGYRFSDRININGSINQITVGRNAGDYLYEAESEIQLSKSVGRVILGAYIQNKSPEALFELSKYHYHQWPKDNLQTNFENTKINNLSFTYLNNKYAFRAKAEYFLISKYLYYKASGDPDSLQIAPVQAGNLINMLKITGRKDFTFGRFTLESYVALQKSDFQNILLTPEIYTFNSFYYKRRFSNSLNAHAGFDVRWNSNFNAPSYAINVSQFYVGKVERFDSYNYPIVDVWGEFGLKRANIFLRYDYANQGLFSKGYYTVNRYPMPGALLRFGVQWNFYD